GNPFAALNDDLIHRFAAFLAPVELARVALTCKRFGGKARVEKKKKRASSLPRWRNRKRKNTKNTEQTNGNDTESPQLSLMEEVARTQIDAAKTDAWKEEWVGTNVWKLTNRRANDSWFVVYSAVCLMRTSLVFYQFIGNGAMYVKRNPTMVQVLKNPYGDYHTCAICHDVMEEGKHFAEFTCVREGYFDPGIIRPSLDRFENRYTDEIYSGNDQFFVDRKHPDGGRVSILYQVNDVVGLLLDLCEGTLTVYKNGKHLGIKKRGLSGSYRWAVCVTYFGARQRSALKI
ncbi:hypothetical protein ACHAWF_005962, partial [Thalassiosira exigua]